MTTRHPRPHPELPTVTVETATEPEAETADLLRQLATLRAKIREINRERGRTSLTLHTTRLELSKARADSRAGKIAVEEQATQARTLYYMLRELLEIMRPGMTHGDLDDDYKLAIAELRRLRSLDI